MRMNSKYTNLFPIFSNLLQNKNRIFSSILHNSKVRCHHGWLTCGILREKYHCVWQTPHISRRSGTPVGHSPRSCPYPQTKAGRADSAPGVTKERTNLKSLKYKVNLWTKIRLTLTWPHTDVWCIEVILFRLIYKVALGKLIEILYNIEKDKTSDTW